MAKSVKLSLILFVLYVFTAAIAMARKLEESDSDTEFIRTSCKATTFPDLCFRSLSSHASEIKKQPRRLTETALAISIAQAKSAKAYISQMTDYKGITKRQHEAVLDCVEEMTDSVDRLSKSLQELKQLGKRKRQGDGHQEQDFWFCLSNVRTWTSAALTDENTCLDAFGGKAMDGELKGSIRTHVVGVAQETSNALALINEFASKP